MDDLISRQSALEALTVTEEMNTADLLWLMTSRINDLPTAEPSGEFIRCKDCEYYKGLAVCMIHGEKCGGTNYFCAWAERRIDE